MALHTTHMCLDCSGKFHPNNSQQMRCQPCRSGAGARIRSKAVNMVARAVRSGALADLKQQNVGCLDCGARACEYDHRDYSRPLEVDPVCRACNRKRGSVACFIPQDQAA